MMKIEKFGTLSDGREVDLITLSTERVIVKLLNYGARVQSLIFDGVDTVLGYDTIEGYERCTSYQGTTVGRYANRIADGIFFLGGEKYDVGTNSNGVHLHGGYVGFDRHVWSYKVCEEENSVIFKHFSPDGDMGYPGNMEITVKYEIVDSALSIEYSANSDKDTVISLTNHCYFNLDGEGDILSQELYVNSSAITPLASDMIPTGELMSVEGTPFDFRVPKKLGADINSDFDQISLTGGFDHNFALDGEGMRTAAIAYSEKSGIQLECKTDRPGLQLYTSNCLDAGEGIGKNGVEFFKWQAFCLETQGFPDSPNKEQFPSAVLRKGETWNSKTVYSFSKK